MARKLILAVTTLAFLAPMTTAPAFADHERRAWRGNSEYSGKQRYRKYRGNDDDRSYSWRARELDPAGDYKGYPDWARVALSPKSGGGGYRR